MLSYVAIFVACVAWVARHPSKAARHHRAALVSIHLAQNSHVDGIRLWQSQESAQESAQKRSIVACGRNQDKWECRQRPRSSIIQVCVRCNLGNSWAVKAANQAQRTRIYREDECKIIEPWANSTDAANIKEKKAELKRKKAERQANAVALAKEKKEKCKVVFCQGSFAGTTLYKWFCASSSGSSRCVCTNNDDQKSAARLASKNRGVLYQPKDCRKVWAGDRREEENREAEANEAKAARARRLKAKQDAEAERIAKRQFKKLREGVLEVDWKQVVCANEQDLEWQYSYTCARMQWGKTSGTWQIGGNQLHVQKWFCSFSGTCLEGKPCEGVCPCLEAEANASAAATSALKFPQFPGRWANCRRFPDSSGKGVQPAEKYREKIVQKASSIASALDFINTPSEALVGARQIEQKCSDGLQKLLMIKNVPENDIKERPGPLPVLPATEPAVPMLEPSFKIDKIEESKDILVKVIELSVGLLASSGDLTDLVNSKADRLTEDIAGLGDKLNRQLKSSSDKVKVEQKVDMISSEIEQHLEDSLDAVSRVVLMDSIQPVRVVAEILEDTSKKIKDIEVIAEQPIPDVVDVVQKKLEEVQERSDALADIAEDDSIIGKSVREIKAKASSDVREQLIALEDIGTVIHETIVVPHLKEKEQLLMLTDGNVDEVNEDLNLIDETIHEATKVYREVESAAHILQITLEPDDSDGIRGLEEARIITPLLTPTACSASAPSKLSVRKVPKSVRDHEMINGVYLMTTSFTPLKGCPVYKREGHDKFLYYKEKSGDWRIGDWMSGELQDQKTCDVHSALMAEETSPTKPRHWFEVVDVSSLPIWVIVEVVHDPEAKPVPVERFVHKNVVEETPPLAKNVVKKLPPPAKNVSVERVALRHVVKKAPSAPGETPPCEWSRHSMCENVKRFLEMARQSEEYKFKVPTSTCDSMLDTKTAGCFTCCSRVFAFLYLQQGLGTSKWCPAFENDSPCPAL